MHGMRGLINRETTSGQEDAKGKIDVLPIQEVIGVKPSYLEPEIARDRETGAGEPFTIRTIGPFATLLWIAHPSVINVEIGAAEPDPSVRSADHGCDPTTPSTDHSREYTPLLAFGPRARAGVDLGLRETLSDIGQTVAENFATSIEKGKSFLSEIRL